MIQASACFWHRKPVGSKWWFALSRSKSPPFFRFFLLKFPASSCGDRRVGQAWRPVVVSHHNFSQKQTDRRGVALLELCKSKKTFHSCVAFLLSCTKNLATYHPTVDKQHPCKLTMYFKGRGHFTVYRRGLQRRKLCKDFVVESDFTAHHYTTLWKFCYIGIISEKIDSLSLFTTVFNDVTLSQQLSPLLMKQCLWTSNGNSFSTTPVFLPAIAFSSSIQMSLYFCQFIWWCSKNWSKHWRIHSPVVYVSNALWSNKST